MRKGLSLAIFAVGMMSSFGAMAENQYDSEGRIIRKDFDGGGYETYVYGYYGYAYGTVYDSSGNETGVFNSYGDSWAAENGWADTDTVVSHSGTSWIMSGDGWSQTDSFDSAGRQTGYIYTDTDGGFDGAKITYNGDKTVMKEYNSQSNYENETLPSYVQVDSPTVNSWASFSYDDSGAVTYVSGYALPAYGNSIDVSNNSISYQDGNIVVTNQWGSSMTFDSDGNLISSTSVGYNGEWNPDTQTVVQTYENRQVYTYNDDGSLSFERYMSPIDPDTGEIGDPVLDMKQNRYQTAAGFVWEELDPQTNELTERYLATNDGFGLTYDADGRLIGHDHIGQFAISYNSDGSFVATDDDYDVSVAYGADGKIQSMTVDGEVLGVSYDSEGNLTITNSDGGHETFDSSGHLVSMNSCYEYIPPMEVLK